MQPCFERQDSLITLRSDTELNVRGAGHTLERIYTYLGGKVEGWMNKVARQTGKTPAALEIELERLGEKLRAFRKPNGEITGQHQDIDATRPLYGDFGNLTDQEVNLVMSLCRALLRWTR